MSQRRLSNRLLIALALAVVAAFLRSRHLAWGLPDLEEEAFPLKKAFEMCGWGTKTMRLDPDTAGWPSLSFYVHMLVQHLHYWTGRLSGEFADRGDYFLQQTTWTPIAVWARSVGVLASSVVVLVGARLGHRLAGWGGGLVTGLILAASPMLTQHAQLITPDILLVMFTALALERFVDIAAKGRARDYLWAGLWIGLGVSTKYTPILLAPAFYVAHLMGLHHRSVGLRALGLGDKYLWWAVLACVLVFAATSPFVLVNTGILSRDMDHQMSHLQQGHFGHDSQNPGLVFYAFDVLAPGMGWPAFLLGLTGLVAAAIRKRGSWWVLLAGLLAYYLVLSLLQTRFDRYLLPGLLPLALGVAGWWALLGPWFQARSRNMALVGVVLLALVVTIPPMIESLLFVAKQGQPGTRQLAKDWILQHRDGNGPYLAMELYTPALPRAKQIRLRRGDPAFANLSPEQQRRWLDLDPVSSVYLPFYSTREGAADFYYDLRHYLNYDFVVTSSAVRQRYENSPARYRQQVKFYEDLETHLKDVQVFAPGPRRRGPEIRIYAITPEIRAHLKRTLPPLTRDDFRAAASAVQASHFHNFVKTVASHATERGDAKTSAAYFQPLYETLPPDQRDEFLPAYANATVHAGLWQQAEPLLRRWRRLDPANPVPVGYLGLVQRELGNPDQARVGFLACLDLAADKPQYAALTVWVRQQLDALTPDQ